VNEHGHSISRRRKIKREEGKKLENGVVIITSDLRSMTDIVRILKEEADKTYNA
jgi:hypothetical protein